MKRCPTPPYCCSFLPIPTLTHIACRLEHSNIHGAPAYGLCGQLSRRARALLCSTFSVLLLAPSVSSVFQSHIRLHYPLRSSSLRSHIDHSRSQLRLHAHPSSRSIGELLPRNAREARPIPHCHPPWIFLAACIRPSCFGCLIVIRVRMNCFARPCSDIFRRETLRLSNDRYFEHHCHWNGRVCTQVFFS